jgi:hypothetical protein
VLLLRPLFVGFVGLFCAMMLPAMSETIHYDGRTAVLQNAPPPFPGMSNTLAPAGYTSTSGNTLTIDSPAGSGGKDLKYVFGGFSNVPGVTVTNNAVDVINGTSRRAMIIGGYNSAGNSGDNAVTVGGGGATTIIGGVARSGNAARNRINLSGGTAGNVIGGTAQSGNATGNTVSVSGESELCIVAGGAVFDGTTGVAADNTVSISGGTVSDFVGGGGSIVGNATGNTVMVQGGRVSGSLVGGFIKKSASSAMNNNVTLAGGTISGFVLGGLSYSGNATGNTVTVRGGIAAGGVIGGGANIESVAELFGGGTTHARNTGDIRTGNILHLDNWSGSTRAIVKNFEHYRFTLPAAAANGQSILTLTGDGSVDLGTNADIRVAFAGKPIALKAGDKVYLINVRGTSGVITGSLASTTATFRFDETDYTFHLALEVPDNSGYKLLTATRILSTRP